MFDMGLNNDVMKYCDSGIPYDWVMSILENIEGLPIVVTFQEN